MSHIIDESMKYILHALFTFWISLYSIYQHSVISHESCNGPSTTDDINENYLSIQLGFYERVFVFPKPKQLYVSIIQGSMHE